jgi:hypothetical protein
MKPLVRRKLGIRLAAVLVTAAAFLMLLAPQASAYTFYGDYLNPAGRYGGNYSWIDCNGCSNDNTVLVRDYTDRYHVRVRFQADAYDNGVYYTYLSKILVDGQTGKWYAGIVPKGRVRLQICFYNSSWTYIGRCNYHYGYNSYGN